MKKLLTICVMLIAMTASAQNGTSSTGKIKLKSNGIARMGTPFETTLADGIDSSINVRCSYDDIQRLVHPNPHSQAVSLFHGSQNDTHECSGNNEWAQSVYLARLHKLCNHNIRHKQLSSEVKKINCNFEQLTGIQNSGTDGDFFGMLYIMEVRSKDGRHGSKRTRTNSEYVPNIGCYTQWSQKPRNNANGTSSVPFLISYHEHLMNGFNPSAIIEVRNDETVIPILK